HVAHAGRDRGEGSHDRQEAGEDDGEATEALEELVSALYVRDAEDPGFFALEDFRASLMANQVPHFTAEERREADSEAHPPDVEFDHPGEGQHAGDEEQGVAREEESDKQAGL